MGTHGLALTFRTRAAAGPVKGPSARGAARGDRGRGDEMATARKSRKKETKAEAPKHEPRAKIPGLSARPVWQGHLRLSLVSCPVALYKATTKANDISFNLINPETNNRIRMIPTDP